MLQSLTIAVDFDGTIVENKYPEIGKPMLFAFETLRKFQEEGHRIILWTYRYGDKLEEAVAFCKSKGIEFYAVNKSYPEEDFDNVISRKILADIYIDDRNIGGMIGWGEIYQKLSNNKTQKTKVRRKKPGLFDRLKNKL
ncbi:BT0820 family HAD-type phosphatase [Autumnicola edwardsiae]|jgi:2-hydroxy-3-keto-5-methylthiopentenyl-1-phosphate phosphatase|uniref:Hydrolase n=1 Tax=Autumnicola edwardsiae TaxID=3075594 RepID=A0ABU3CTP5_9FLAO|nr:hydrolase [Zunongwangia sp. F297]MDT0649728.1 hydrolase [Zunongwangia sp. F297]